MRVAIHWDSVKIYVLNPSAVAFHETIAKVNAATLTIVIPLALRVFGDILLDFLSMLTPP